MTINDWLSNERPREKLLTKGTMALSDAELLAILLRIGKKGKTAVDLARELLTAFGGLRNLLTASQKDLCKYSGIGLTKYVQLQAALELARRQLQVNIAEKDVLSNSNDTKCYLASCLQQHKQEVFACLFLDNRNHIICYKELFYGTINKSTIHPREVVKKALDFNASAIILAHNHLSGIAEPSQADLCVTRQLVKTLALVDVRVLDHIIIGDGKIISLLESEPECLCYS
jgi:DNA repair protein RadC